VSAPAVAPTLPAKPVDRFKWVFTAVVAVLVVWAAAGLDIKWSRLLEAPADMWTLARLMFTQIDWSDFPDLVAAMWQSISMAWLGTLIAAGFAVPLAFLAAENLVAGPIAWVVRQVFNILRAVPEIILALAFIPLFGLTAMAGVMAIAVGSIGTLGKLFYEIIEGVGAGPLEAADAVGSSPVQRLRWGVLPQVTPEMAAFVLYRFEVNIRASAVMGLVGAGGIGADLAQALQFKEYGRAGLGLIIVVAGTIAVDVVSGLVRRRIVAGRPAALEDDDAGEVYVP
jgi:phosphonate transport system permease protein